MDKSFEEYYKEEIEAGYIAEDGCPLKCHHCESVDLDEKYFYGEFSFVIEIDVSCNNCGKKIGDWAYGNWML